MTPEWWHDLQALIDVIRAEAVAEEREACARIAEADSVLSAWPLTCADYDAERAAKRKVAATIRARGQA